MAPRSELPPRYSAAVDQQAAAIRDLLPRLDPPVGLLADLIISQYVLLALNLTAATDLTRVQVIQVLSLMNLAMADAVKSAVNR